MPAATIDADGIITCQKCWYRNLPGSIRCRYCPNTWSLEELPHVAPSLPPLPPAPGPQPPIPNNQYIGTAAAAVAFGLIVAAYSGSSTMRTIGLAACGLGTFLVTQYRRMRTEYREWTASVQHYQNVVNERTRLIEAGSKRTNAPTTGSTANDA